MKKHKELIIAVLAGMLIIGGCSSNSTEPANSNTPSTTDPAPTESAGSTSEPSNSSNTPSTNTIEAADDSGLTQQVTQGPYYVTGTSELTAGNLNYDSLAGDPIKVQGYVYAGETGTTPVAGAMIEIWHADNTGNYRPNSNGAASSYDASELSLRGYVLTDENGYYEYTTIYPGEYRGRTRHIHTNTTADGYKGVITQLIIPSLEGDDMTADEDNIAQSLPAYNQVTFTTVDGVPTTTFNYRIAAN